MIAVGLPRPPPVVPRLPTIPVVVLLADTQEELELLVARHTERRTCDVPPDDRAYELAA